MAGSRKKPGKFPDWLFDAKICFPHQKMCLWLCSGCGGPEWYEQKDGKHGRPGDAIPSHPHLAPRVGPCWRSKAYGVKCVTPKGGRYVYHEGKPAVGQPDQPDLANIETIIATRGGRRKDNREAREDNT